MPLFMLASAREGKKGELAATSTPAAPSAMRLTLGNLAAGAVAGCAVESGALDELACTARAPASPVHDVRNSISAPQTQTSGP